MVKPPATGIISAVIVASQVVVLVRRAKLHPVAVPMRQARIGQIVSGVSAESRQAQSILVSIHPNNKSARRSSSDHSTDAARSLLLRHATLQDDTFSRYLSDSGPSEKDEYSTDCHTPVSRSSYNKRHNRPSVAIKQLLARKWQRSSSAELYGKVSIAVFEAPKPPGRGTTTSKYFNFVSTEVDGAIKVCGS